MRAERLAAFVLLLACTAALANDDGPTPPPGDDKAGGLVWGKDQPKAFPGGAASQIQVNGGVDTTKYKDGLILDDPKVVQVYVYTYDAQTGKRADKHLYNTKLDVKDLKTWAGSTKRTGGFPAGLYSVEIKVEKFRPKVGDDPRPAILTKEPFEIK